MNDSQDIVRVLRLVEYEGPRYLVEKQIAGSINGTRTWEWPTKQIGLRDKIRLTAITLDQFPVALEEARRTPEPKAITELRNQLTDAQTEIAELRQEIDGVDHE